MCSCACLSSLLLILTGNWKILKVPYLRSCSSLLALGFHSDKWRESDILYVKILWHKELTFRVDHVLHSIIVLYFIYTSGLLGYCNEESCFVLYSKAREAVFEYDVKIYIYICIFMHSHIFCVRHFLQCTILFKGGDGPELIIAQNCCSLSPYWILHVMWRYCLFLCFLEVWGEWICVCLFFFFLSSAILNISKTFKLHFAYS